MVQWSYDLLAPEVRSTFARLGVFRSSLTVAAAESVCAVGETTARDVLWHITALVDHSLLVRDPAPAPASRYRLLETLRLFAQERLDDDGLVEPTARAHADYFCRLAEAGSTQMYGPDEVSWRIRLDLEDANMHAAMAWADEHDHGLALRLAVARWPYSEVRWRERQSVARLERLLRQPVDVPAELHAWALTALAVMAGNPGDARSAIPHAVEAVAACRGIGIDDGLAVALGALGAAFGNRGRLDEAGAAVAEGLALAERVDDARVTARLLEVASFIARRRGDHVTAADYGRQELATWRNVGSRRGEATALRHVAISLQQLGAADEATALCNEALQIWAELDDPAAVAHVETTLADIARMSGDLAGAVPRYDTALVNLRAIGDRRCTASTFKNLAAIAAQRGQHPRAADLYRQGLTLRHELGDEAGLAEVLEGLAAVRSAEGSDDCAATLIAAADALRERTGSAASPEEADVIRRAVDACRHQLGPERFNTSYARGRLMTVADIVEFALR
jgi:tetratricopeptide (TPR) repeat protein